MKKLLTIAAVASMFSVGTPAFAADATCIVGGQYIQCSKVKPRVPVDYIPGCSTSNAGKKIKYGKMTFTCNGY